MGSLISGVPGRAIAGLLVPGYPGAPPAAGKATGSAVVTQAVASLPVVAQAVASVAAVSQLAGSSPLVS